MKGQEWKESVTKKAKGKRKGAMEPTQKKGADVIIYIVLVTWSEKCGCHKKKHGKRLALRVNTKDSAFTILQKAVSKWKAFNSDCYIEDEEYMLLLEDFQEAIFLPGSNKEFFTLKRYQEDLGKDFKRITFYLCAKSDFLMHEFADEKNCPKQLHRRQR